MIFFSQCVIGQDFHFTQTYTNPLYFNPANTGHFVGDWRASVTYREQWASLAVPFTTISAAYDQQIYYIDHRFSGGIYVVNDQSGTIGLNNLNIYGSGAYHRTFWKHELHGGIQVGYITRNYNLDGFTLPSQWNRNTGYYDGGVPFSEDYGDYISYIDVNAGVMWRTSIDIYEPEAGIAFFHINRPNSSFEDNEYSVPLRWLIHAKTSIRLTEEISVVPSLIFHQQKRANEFLVGGEGVADVFNETSHIRKLYLGVFMRGAYNSKIDALAVTGGFQYKNIDFGISYDFNISPLSEVTNNKGAFEITLIYRSITTILNSYAMPCERL